MNELTQYLASQLARGYTKEQLRTYLLSYGYDARTVEDAFSELAQKNYSPSQQTQGVQQAISQQQPTAQQDINTQLKNYVLTYLQQGYGAQQLFDHLLKQGFNKEQLQTVFEQLNKENFQGELSTVVHHKHEVGTRSIIKVAIMMIAVIIIFAGGYYYLNDGVFTSDFKILDLSIEVQDDFYRAGEILEAKVSLINKGDPGIVDVEFIYTIFDDKDFAVFERQDTRAFETTMSFVSAIRLPQRLSSGNYVLQVKADYAGEQARSEYPFSIQESLQTNRSQEPTYPSQSQGSFEDNNGSETRREDKGENELDEGVVIEQFTQPLTTADQTNLNTALAQTDPYVAKDYCALIEDPLLQSQCYVYVADTTGDPDFCSSIQQERRREDCYINFVLAGHRELCMLINLPENKMLCKELTQLQLAQDYFETGDPTALLNSMGKTLPDEHAFNDSTQNDLHNFTQNNTGNLSQLPIDDFLS